MSKYVAIVTLGVVEIHLPHPDGNSATLCGLDGDDPHHSVQQTCVDVPKGAKVDCRLCWSIFRTCKDFTVRDFYSSVRE
ncbi:MAG: hypothetical protein KA314_04685 [Chloroflexi bacterium]|nr:hypothetical protein [Chloroflexota bacterium]